MRQCEPGTWLKVCKVAECVNIFTLLKRHSVVPLKHVREHNPRWYAELAQSGKVEQVADTNVR